MSLSPEDTIAVLRQDRDQLALAIRTHAEQKADDRCQFDDEELYKQYEHITGEKGATGGGDCPAKAVQAVWSAYQLQQALAFEAAKAAQDKAGTRGVAMTTAETALLFLQLIMRKLHRQPAASGKPARAAVVVPDGTLMRLLTMNGVEESCIVIATVPVAITK